MWIIRAAASRFNNLRIRLTNKEKRPSFTQQDANAPNQDVKRNTVSASRQVFIVIQAGVDASIVSIAFQQGKLRQNRA